MKLPCTSSASASASPKEIPRAQGAGGSEVTATGNVPRQLPPNPKTVAGVGSTSSATSSNSRVFYKTRLCVKFMKGCCPYRSCCFAHGHAELRDPAHNWRDHVDRRGGGSGGGGGFFGNGRLCKKYSSGEECPYGESCSFVHERTPSHRVLVDATGRSSESSFSFSVERKGISGGSAVGITPTMGERRDVGPITKASLSRSAAVKSSAPYNLRQAQIKKQLLFARKINGIYGDWLEGLSPDGVKDPGNF